MGWFQSIQRHFPVNTSDIDRLVHGRLGHDGVLIVHFISGHVGDMLVAELALEIKELSDRLESHAAANPV